MGVMEHLKSSIRRYAPIWSIICRMKARRLERTYRVRRERYTAMAVSGEGLQRSPETRAWPGRSIGEIHTFAIIPTVSWHADLLPELHILGPVTHFDYQAFALIPNKNTHFLQQRREMNKALLNRFEAAYQERPVDWIFAYTQGDHILADIIRTIRERYDVPAVNICLDDKQSWNGGMIGEQINGSQGLVAAFDLWWTSASVVVDWVRAEGGRAIYLPEGCLPSRFYPADVPFDIPVSFIGASYGPRPLMIHELKSCGIPVQAFGPGWGKHAQFVQGVQLVDIIRRSQLNLGMGGILHSERLTNVKTRDFEIPCTGGGAYITTFNADLSRHFTVGSEILCWHTYDELIEQVRYYLDRPDECRDMAMRARDRCLREHRWVHRYQKVLQTLGILDEDAITAAAPMISQTAVS